MIATIEPTDKESNMELEEESELPSRLQNARQIEAKHKAITSLPSNWVDEVIEHIETMNDLRKHAEEEDQRRRDAHAERFGR